MSINTNRLEIKFDIDAIKNDFTFLRFDRQSKERDYWYGAERLDSLISNDYNAFSVLYKPYRYSYAMFKRQDDIRSLISKIRKNCDFSEDAVYDVQPVADAARKGNCIGGAWLAQLLINSLASSRSRYKNFHYCNLTGSLRIVPDPGSNKRDYIDTFDISLDDQCDLIISVKRYRTCYSVQRDHSIDKSGLDKRPKYILHSGTGALRRLLPRDGEIDPKKIYIEAAIQNRRAHAPFIDFRSHDAYKNSRVGVFHDVLTRIQEHLSKYMSFELISLDVSQVVELKTTIMNDPKHIQSLLVDQPIHLVDLVESDESSILAQSLKEGYLEYIRDPKLLTIGKREKKNAFNCRIIHDMGYYDENKLKDRHLDSNSKILRQNVTIEENGEVSNAIVKTLVKELLIKRDIQEGRLSLFDWSRLNATEVWTFASYDYSNNVISFMDIFPDGRFELRKGRKSTQDCHDKYSHYVELFENSRGKSKSLKLEGLVVTETGDKNVIYRTDRITIPDLQAIEKILLERDKKLPQRMKTGSALALVIRECIADVSQFEAIKTSALIDELNALGHQEISKQELKTLMNKNLGATSNAAAHVREWLYEKHGVRLHFPKTKENMNDLFNENIDIKYFGETDHEAYYFVGEKLGNIKLSINNACHLRKIVAVDNSKLRFKEILPTMDVDFVRTGDSTVLPFPFKYLREYSKFKT